MAKDDHLPVGMAVGIAGGVNLLYNCAMDSHQADRARVQGIALEADTLSLPATARLCSPGKIGHRDGGLHSAPIGSCKLRLLRRTMLPRLLVFVDRPANEVGHRNA